MPSKEKITANDLLKLLHDKYEERAGWMVFSEVRNGTGYETGQKARSADAIVLQTFPSRGICAHGFEIKVSKSDLVKELRELEKADAIQQWCEYWWLVVSDRSLIKDVAVPELWGILVAENGKLKVIKEAPKLTPEPWTPRFVAAVLRAYQRGLIPKSDLDSLKENIEQIVADKLNEKLVAEVDVELRTAKQELDVLRGKVRLFEEVSGIKIEWGWQLGAVGKVARAMAEVNNLAATINNVLFRTKALEKVMKEALVELNKVKVE